MVLRCVYCHDDLGRRDRVFCATCLAPHHAGCRHTHGRCAAPGCDERQIVRPRLPRAPREDRPAPPSGRGRAGALLTGMAGVAIGCVVVAAGVAAGEALSAAASVSSVDVGLPPSIRVSPAAPIEVRLESCDHPDADLMARVRLEPGDRLLFVMGPARLDILRLDSGDAAIWIWRGDRSDVDVRLASGDLFTHVAAGSCLAVIAFDPAQATGLSRIE